MERSLALNPANAKAHYNLGLIAAQAGGWPTPKRTSSAPWPSTPSDPDIAQALAQIARAARKEVSESVS